LLCSSGAAQQRKQQTDGQTSEIFLWSQDACREQWRIYNRESRVLRKSERHSPMGRNQGGKLRPSPPLLAVHASNLFAGERVQGRD
jgi:hypothetical protein